MAGCGKTFTIAKRAVLAHERHGSRRFVIYYLFKILFETRLVGLEIFLGSVSYYSLSSIFQFSGAKFRSRSKVLNHGRVLTSLKK